MAPRPSPALRGQQLPLHKPKESNLKAKDQKHYSYNSTQLAPFPVSTKTTITNTFTYFILERSLSTKPGAFSTSVSPEKSGQQASACDVPWLSPRAGYLPCKAPTTSGKISSHKSCTQASKQHSGSGNDRKWASSTLLDQAFLRPEYQASGVALIMFKLKLVFAKYCKWWCLWLSGSECSFWTVLASSSWSTLQSLGEETPLGVSHRCKTILHNIQREREATCLYITYT